MSPAVFGHGRLRLYLLKLLDESPRHGYDVIRELEDRFMGLYSPSAGTVYPRLARLESEGLVTHVVSEGRKVYSITDAGRAELAARRSELDDLEADIAGSVSDFADEIRTEVHGSVRDLKAELKAAAREMRRETRSRGRQAPPAPPHPPAPPAPPGGWGPGGPPGPGRTPPGTDDPWSGIVGFTSGLDADLGAWLRDQLADLGGRPGRRIPDERQRAEIKAVVARAVDDIRTILRETP